MQGQGFFRQEALQHQYTSLEDLEKPFKLLRIGTWLPLLALGLLCTAGLVWAIFGRVPESVEGTGVLLYPGRVRTIESLVAGRITEVRVTRGAHIHEGDVVTILDMPELRQQIAQAEARLSELTRSDKAQQELENLRLQQELKLRKIQEASLDNSIRDLQTLLERQERESEQALREQRVALEKNFQDTKKLSEALQTRADSARRLADSRVVPGEILLQSETALTENKSQLSSLEVRLTELRLKETESRQSLVTQRARLADFRVQREQLDVKSTQLEQEINLARVTRKLQIQEQDARVGQLRVSLKEQGEIRSPYTGRVLEAPLLPGQAVSSGNALVILNQDSSSGSEEDTPMRNVAYFPIKAGKRIQPGMAVRIAPTSVQRERFGSLIGTVRRVSEYPVGSRTPAAAVGNPELAQAFLNPAGIIEVEVDLEPADTPTGYRWTSAGPPQPLTAGTTTRTTVNVEERAPITFLLPILRGWLDSSSSPDEPQPATTNPGQKP